MKQLTKLGAMIAVASAITLGAPSASAGMLWETVPAPTAYPTPSSEGYSDINGIRLYHAEWGAGDPVILLHGGLGSIEAFANQIPLLAKTNRVIAVDTRGHGRSTRDETPYSYALLANDVVALMDEMNIASAAFIGWSDGGITSLELAINHPSRISKALVIGTNYTLDGIDHSVETNPVFGDYVGKAAAIYGAHSTTPDQFEAFVGDIAGMWGSQPNYSDADLQSIKTQFRVVQAKHDEAIFDEHAAKMASLIPGATYVVLDGVSHFAMWQDPAKFNAEIAAFLAH